MKWFRSSSSESQKTATAGAGQKLTRRSSGLGELYRHLGSQSGLCILDLGSTSASNIRLFAELGHKIYSEDLLIASSDPGIMTQDAEGKPQVDVRRYLAENLVYEGAQFDCVLCWNLPDYLEESLVKPVIDRLWSMMKPGGMLLVFFHTKDAGPDAPCYRYHIIGNDSLEMTPITAHPELSRRPGRFVKGFRLQRVFNNRHIETLFRDFTSIKFFLARDTIREVLVIR